MALFSKCFTLKFLSWKELWKTEINLWKCGNEGENKCSSETGKGATVTSLTHNCDVITTHATNNHHHYIHNYYNHHHCHDDDHDNHLNTRMLSSFTSRWQSPLEWIHSKAEPIWVVRHIDISEQCWGRCDNVITHNNHINIIILRMLRPSNHHIWSLYHIIMIESWYFSHQLDNHHLLGNPLGVRLPQPGLGDVACQVAQRSVPGHNQCCIGHHQHHYCNHGDFKKTHSVANMKYPSDWKTVSKTLKMCLCGQSWNNPRISHHSITLSHD